MESKEGGSPPPAMASDAVVVHVAAIASTDRVRQLGGAKRLRELLSAEQSPPIAQVIEAGGVPPLVALLAHDDAPELQCEAAWALTNIVSGTSEHVAAVLQQEGALPALVRLLGSPSDDVREQAMWALGNIAGDSPECRDTVLREGALAPLLAQLTEHSTVSTLRTGVWMLSNCCRGKPVAVDPGRAGAPPCRPLVGLGPAPIHTHAHKLPPVSLSARCHPPSLAPCDTLDVCHGVLIGACLRACVSPPLPTPP